MSETIASGITIIIPSLGDTNWAQLIKDECFQKISEHDHTGSGRGVQIATDAIANSAVSSVKLANEAVTEGKLAPNSVTEAKIFNLQVTTGKLAASAVTTAKIADANVTSAKLAADAASRSAYILRSTSAYVDGTAAATAMPRGEASTGFGTPTKLVLPKACKITHLSIAAGAVITGGALVLTLYKNGSTTGQDITISSITNGGAYNYGAITAQSFAAGDTIEFAITRSGVVFSGGVSTVMAEALGHFTE